ncbi:MAG: glycosyltransferase family 9 protein [Bernardetiaceae bacterium]|nr:glycosyltransferase family 9 protein [Bernardetiaceae bacterium]
MQRLLIIQTAFIGDVILATALIEKMKLYYQNNVEIDFLLRKGNESLLQGHPHIRHLWIWDKQKNKYGNMWRLIGQLRQQAYTHVVNVQRFAASGIFTVLAGAKQTVGFDKNPLSCFFTRRVVHTIGNGQHEIERNQLLISHLTDNLPALPRLYPLPKHYEQVAVFKRKPYVCLAPASVWFTKQFPAEKWIELVDKLPPAWQVLLMGGKEDSNLCEYIRQHARHPQVQNIAGKLSLLAAAALMQHAHMNYVNDSAPMHLASAVNAPVCAIFCSTVPAFGYTPLSEKKIVIETPEKLSCRPCGLHGKSRCPKGHFQCATSISTDVIIAQTLDVI